MLRRRLSNLSTVEGAPASTKRHFSIEAFIHIIYKFSEGCHFPRAEGQSNEGDKTEYADPQLEGLVKNQKISMPLPLPPKHTKARHHGLVNVIWW